MKWWCCLIIILFCSCSNTKKEGKSWGEINFFSAEERRMYMDELFDRIEVIPLETNPNCLLQEYPRILGITDQYILVSNTFGNACLFDRKDGKFIHNVGQQGQGPDEYLVLGSTFDKREKLMYADKGNTWMGIHIETNRIEERIKKPRFTGFKIAGGVANPYRLDDSLYIGYINNVTGSVQYRFTLFNKEGESIKLYPNPFQHPVRITNSFYHCYGNFYRYKNDLCFYGGLIQDTIYTIQEDSFQKRYVFHFNEKPFPYGKLYSEETSVVNYTHLARFMEYDSYLLFTFNSNQFAKFGIGYYDRQKKMTVLCAKEDQTIHFRDENYPPLYLYYMDEEGNVAGYWSAQEWIDFVERKGDSFQVPENLRNVKFDDNPILVIAHVKMTKW